MKNYLTLSFLMGSAASLWAQPQYYDPQPQSYSSYTLDHWGDKITDREIAQWAGEALLKNGQANVRGATFMFAQPYGGGMLNELEYTLGDKVRWVGGAGSRYDQSSWVNSENADFPLTTWYKGFNQATKDVTPPGLPMIQYINKARDLDSTGPSGTNKSLPQSIYRNGGETINHQDPIAGLGGTNHIFVWAGGSDRKSANYTAADFAYWLKNDLDEMGENYKLRIFADIDVLAPFGIVSEFMDKGFLKDAFTNLAGVIQPEDNFYFLIAGWGGTEINFINSPQFLGALNTLLTRLTLSDEIKQSLFQSGPTGAGLVFDFEGSVVPGIDLFVNGLQVFADPPDPDNMRQLFFPIRSDLLERFGTDWEIEIRNNTLDRVNLLSAYFQTGPVEGVAVPEISSVWLAMAGVALACVIRPRKMGVRGYSGSRFTIAAEVMVSPNELGRFDATAAMEPL